MRQVVFKKSGIYLFKLFGFEVSLDWSWFFVAILVVLTLALVYFPINYPGLNPSKYWLMSVAGSIGLFCSIILHEFSHSLVGRYYGLPIDGIKLFIFGGVAQMHSEPPNPKAEFLMALAGPLFSLSLGLLLALLTSIFISLKLSISLIGTTAYLALINIILGLFNLLPGYPLDGGRILRSFIWWWKNDIRLATQIASRVGIALSFVFIFVGILLLMNNSLIGGVWLLLLGFFLFRLAKISFQQFVIKEIFNEDSIEAYITKKNDWSVPPNITIQECINSFFYTSFQRFYVVTDNEKLMGCITLEKITQVPKNTWLQTPVTEIMEDCPTEIIFDSDTSIREIIDRVISHKIDYIVIVKQDIFQTIISRKNLADIIAIKNSIENAQ